MDLQKIYTDSDFENAVVPEGQVLIFTGMENGKAVTRCKDSSGNFGTIAGNGGGNNSGSSMEFYKCASVDKTAKTWTGYKAVLTDGVYTFEENVTAGLTFGEGFTPKPTGIYDSAALVMISKLFDGNTGPSVTGWIWGYANGELLPDNEITASTRGGLTAVDGVYTLGNGKYFEFNEQVMTGNAPRTFLFHAVLTEGSNAQFVDGGVAGGYQVFSVNWGKTANYVAHHFWDFDNQRFAPLASGEHIIAIVYDGSKLIVYADKTEIGRTDVSLDTGTTYNYTIGYRCIDDWNLNGEWQSKYCVVYDKALTADEIGTVTDEISAVIV